MRQTFALTACAVIFSGLAAAPAAGEQAIPVRPPLWVDADNRKIPEPAERLVSELVDVTRNSWFRHLDIAYAARNAAYRPALDVNAWDEVPDSSWFTNRIGRRPLSVGELIHGVEGLPPEPGRWHVSRLKTQGYTPGFRIHDKAGRQYFLKFDLPEAPERNSAAERISSLIMHAAGYNVPFYDIVRFRPDDLVLDEEAVFEDHLGRKRAMTPADLEKALGLLRPRPDGTLRAIASLNIPGIPKGSFAYAGTRPDDPNDIIPHELRREIRGLYVIASWINHTDTKEVNTLDTYLPDEGFLKHYFIDFGSTLGSGDFMNGPLRKGHEYLFDGSAIGRSFLTLGAWDRPWNAASPGEYPEVGYFQAELFDPGKWKPNYPNLAFQETDEGDAYWGAKIVTAFTDELVSALAAEGRYTRPEVTRNVAQVLRLRKEAIGRYWFDRISPLEDFSLEDGGAGPILRFRDLAVERRYVDSSGRSYTWEVRRPKRPNHPSSSGESDEPGRLELRLPPELPAMPVDRWGRRPLYLVEIHARSRNGGRALPVHVILGCEKGGNSLEVLGWIHAPHGYR